MKIYSATKSQRELFNEHESIIPDTVADYLRQIEGIRGTLKIWKETKVRIGDGDKLVRACSIYDQHGPFFDWVQVQSDENDDFSGYPAKVLLIYEDHNREICFIVHGCNWRNQSERNAETPLTSRWSLGYREENRKIYLLKVKASAISNVLYVVEHNTRSDSPECRTAMGVNVPKFSKERRKYLCDVVHPSCEWAIAFLKMD
jgi:hypothetical protein